MTNRRPLSVWLLLVFVTGGLLAPTVHRVQHGLDRQGNGPCHAEAVHRTDASLWVDESTTVAALDCALCASRLLAAGPPPVPPIVPMATPVERVPSRPHLVTPWTQARHYIRGPPEVVSSPWA